MLNSTSCNMVSILVKYFFNNIFLSVKLQIRMKVRLFIQNINLLSIKMIFYPVFKEAIWW